MEALRGRTPVGGVLAPFRAVLAPVGETPTAVGVFKGFIGEILEPFCEPYLFCVTGILEGLSAAGIRDLLRAEDVEDCRGLARGREGETLAGGTRGEVGGERGGPAFASSKPG